MADVSYYEEVAERLLKKTGLPFAEQDSFEAVTCSVTERENSSIVKGSFRMDTGEATICCCEPYTKRLGKFRLTEDNSYPDETYIELEFRLVGSSDKHVVVCCREDANGNESYSYSVSRKNGLFRRVTENVFDTF